MRHRLSGRHLGRETSHRLALYRNLVTDLLRYERITTTEAKAKEIRPMAERIITMGRKGDLHSRRQAGRFVYDPKVVKKVFDDIGPRMASRPGGYLRITALEPRKGDGAKMAAIEFVDFVDAPPTPRPQRVTASPSTAIAPPVGLAPAPAVEPVEEAALAHVSFENRIVDQRENLIEPETVETAEEPESSIEAEAADDATRADEEAKAESAEAQGAQAAEAEASDSADPHKGEGESGT